MGLPVGADISWLDWICKILTQLNKYVQSNLVQSSNHWVRLDWVVFIKLIKIKKLKKLFGV